MSWLRSFIHNLHTRFIWKLMASYLIVVVVGVITLALSAESVVPTAFNRHMSGMDQMKWENLASAAGESAVAFVFDISSVSLSVHQNPP